MDLQLRGMVALVAAASRGLGKAAALALAGEGASVALCSRTQAIRAAAGEIEALTGSPALGVAADLTQAADIEQLVRETLARFGRIDILILNAGGPPPGAFLALDDHAWQAAFDLTVMSAVRLCRAVLPDMLSRGSGSVVGSLSYSVKQPIDNLVLSNSLRLAVVGFLKTLAWEVGPRGVRVNAVHPGWTKTERVQALLEDRARRAGTTAEAEQDKLAAEIPLGRLGTVEEYGRLVAWLASPAASYLHGQSIFIDGGITRASL